MSLRFYLDGRPVEVEDRGASLLEVLREDLGCSAPKDGCSPQGQCGCCTVLVDGAARVACVTPARRVGGRTVTTVDGIDPAARERWSEVFSECGASQCGFCTPGIITRFESLRAKGTSAEDTVAVERALAAHLCRCTGWRSIVDAWTTAVGGAPMAPPRSAAQTERAARRASIEGRARQQVGPQVALGRAGFAADTAPADALVAVPDGSGGWVVGDTLTEARERSGKVQGRRTTAEARPPLDLPEGDWDVRLRTSWVEPAYLETDATWCDPGGVAASELANGGAFGGKLDGSLGEVARRLADDHGRPVRVVLAREDVVRHGPKRPPVAAGVRRDGTGHMRVVRTPGVAAAITAVAPQMTVEEVDVAGPRTSVALRGAGWVEAAVLVSVATGATTIRSPDGAEASAEVAGDGTLAVEVRCGDPLDDVALRSYCIGAAHMAASWVTSEQLTVDADGEIGDLTIRSFGVLRAAATPRIEVAIVADDGPPVNGSDAVFAAVAAAVWRHQGLPDAWPTGRQLR